MNDTWSVIVEERGREGSVLYREAKHAMRCYWEIGGELGPAAAVALVRVGTVAEWRTHHPWAVERRAEILHRLGSELIRQRAPTCRAQMDEASGWMQLLPVASANRAAPTGSQEEPAEAVNSMPPAPPRAMPGGGTSDAQVRAVEFVRRFTALRTKLALGTGCAAILIAALLWLGRTLLTIETTGTRFGDSVRSGNTIATMIQRLDPYIPTPNRNHGKNTYSMGILLHAADGSARPRLLRVSSGHDASSLQNSRVLGADAARIWFRAPDLGALDLQSGRLLDAAQLASVRSLAPSPSANSPIWRPVTRHSCCTSPRAAS